MPNIILSEQMKDVISICIDQQHKQNNHARNLCVFQKFLAWLSSGNHFYQREQNMSSIKRRNRKKIHECKSNRKKTGECPECSPIPRWIECIRNTDEAAHV